MGKCTCSSYWLCHGYVGKHESTCESLLEDNVNDNREWGFQPHPGTYKSLKWMRSDIPDVDIELFTKRLLRLEDNCNIINYLFEIGISHRKYRNMDLGIEVMVHTDYIGVKNYE